MSGQKMIKVTKSKNGTNVIRCSTATEDKIDHYLHIVIPFGNKERRFPDSLPVLKTYCKLVLKSFIYCVFILAIF